MNGRETAEMCVLSEVGEQWTAFKASVLEATAQSCGQKKSQWQL